VCFTLMGCFWFSRHESGVEPSEADGEVSLTEKVKIYKYKEIRQATDDFNALNKIGEGGFGSVYKGHLKDGKVAAIKVLSAESRQGVKEFLTEINVISEIQHENLVKLYGCCVEGNHRTLVYNYLENKTLLEITLCYTPQAWELYERNELVDLVDIALGGVFDAEEACRYLRIGLLCTQDGTQLRPTMSTVVKDIDTKKITKPGLISDFMDMKVREPVETKTEEVSRCNYTNPSSYNASPSSGTSDNSNGYSSGASSTNAIYSFSITN
ncbi:hypothetical protein HID58_083326, partial [Brassica napus]